MTAFPSNERPLLSSQSNRALGLSEQLCCIHGARQATLAKRESASDRIWRVGSLVGLTTIVEVVYPVLKYPPRLVLRLPAVVAIGTLRSSLSRNWRGAERSCGTRA